MKLLYLDCGMGAAGDMLSAALLELLPDPGAFVEELNHLTLPGVEFSAERITKCGIQGTRLAVSIFGEEEGASPDHHGDAHHNAAHHSDEHHGEDHHGSAHHSDEHHGHPHGAHCGMEQIQERVLSLGLSDTITSNILSVYRLIAKAESEVHGMTVSEIHFHEVGALDAIADVTAFCMLMDRLSPDEVVVSPIHVGSGQVACAHGVLPVPAPATARLLQGIPIYGGQIQGELCTPTGAALIRHFATRFGDMPTMRTHAIGYGMGKKDFPAANCVRAMLGTPEENSASESVFELFCNVDDMTAEEIAFATERLLEEGALDVYTIPIGMKKGRPGTLICALCGQAAKDHMVSLLFRHTSTLGVRERELRRHTLERQTQAFPTPYGNVRRKDALGFGIAHSKYEYEDLAAIAKASGISLGEARREVDAYLRRLQPQSPDHPASQ